jgi:hypothetical protein
VSDSTVAGARRRMDRLTTCMEPSARGVRGDPVPTGVHEAEIALTGRSGRKPETLYGSTYLREALGDPPGSAAREPLGDDSVEGCAIPGHAHAATGAHVHRLGRGPCPGGEPSKSSETVHAEARARGVHATQAPEAPDALPRVAVRAADAARPPGVSDRQGGKVLACLVHAAAGLAGGAAALEHHRRDRAAIGAAAAARRPYVVEEAGQPPTRPSALGPNRIRDPLRS